MPKAVVVPKKQVMEGRAYVDGQAWARFAQAVPPEGLELTWKNVVSLCRVASKDFYICVRPENVYSWVPIHLWKAHEQYQKVREGKLNSKVEKLELLYFWLTKTQPVLDK